MIILPTHNLVMLPGVTYYFTKDYFEELAPGSNPCVETPVVFLVTKTEKPVTELSSEDIYPVGVFGTIIKSDRPDNIGVKTYRRIDVEEVIFSEGKIVDVNYTVKQDIDDLNEAEKHERMTSSKTDLFACFSGYPWSLMARNYLNQFDTYEELIVGMNNHIPSKNDERYAMLEADTVSERYKLFDDVVREVIEFLKVSEEIRKKSDAETTARYREMTLKRQLEVITEELHRLHPEEQTDTERFRMLLKDSGMNETARKEAEKLLKRMEQEGESGHDYGMLYDYLDFVTGLVWKKAPYEEIDIKKAEEILDADHYGMKKAKKRILEQLAVMAIKKEQAGSILLFVGAPGTGKTSIGQSIAKATNRAYVRVSLGGIHDEAEIRGHRRTYVGAMAGRIMEGIRRSGASNPVMVLDEIDKLGGGGFNGDPASALLEVLDPEQNGTYTDHYMNVPYDLSNVLFICTANYLEDIPEPLLNRMEMVKFDGYTESEKVQIAKKHLLPQALKKNGLDKKNLKLSDKVLHTIISDYTMEAGVRGLKKRIDALCRYTALEMMKGDKDKISVNAKNLKTCLDAKPIHHNRVKDWKTPGIITGLAWTAAGGDILFIESMFMKGKGKVNVTGQLGSVMQESVSIALSLVKSMYPDSVKLFDSADLHIHIPEGAVPKDGPSAGITMTTALASLVTGIPVDSTVAMTGEVSLRGYVMPIGGLPEKLMAAVRSGVKKVFIPKANVEDLEDVAEEIKEQLTIVPVNKVSDVLKALKLNKPVCDIFAEKEESTDQNTEKNTAEAVVSSEASEETVSEKTEE